MTTFATTARDPRAAIAWATRDSIFVEYPVKGGGPPYICRFRKSTSGLAAAFNILVEHAEPALRTVPTTHPAIKRKVEQFSEDQRKAAAAVVKRLFR